jgi:signal transduction histidine kinase
MRTIVAASQVESGDLSDLAEEWRLEAELRCESAGQELLWSREGDLRLSARQRYQLERVVRELISNAIEHGQGRRIEVAWRVAGDRLELRVADDGNGMPADTAPSGVLARAADLEGAAHWAPRAGGGTEAIVSVPARAASALAAEEGGP